MSAYVVSKRHVDALVEASLRTPPNYENYRFAYRHDGEWHTITHADADRVGAMLWAENVRSVEYRYSPPGREAIYGDGWETPEQSLPGTYQLEMIAPGIEPIETPEWSSEYRYDLRSPALEPVAILKAISCFDYQSCEHPEWEESEAYAFCEALKDKMIGMLPGYDKAEWGL